MFDICHASSRGNIVTIVAEESGNKMMVKKERQLSRKAEAYPKMSWHELADSRHRTLWIFCEASLSVWNVTAFTKQCLQKMVLSFA